LFAVEVHKLTKYYAMLGVILSELLRSFNYFSSLCFCLVFLCAYATFVDYSGVFRTVKYCMLWLTWLESLLTFILLRI